MAFDKTSVSGDKELSSQYFEPIAANLDERSDRLAFVNQGIQIRKNHLPQGVENLKKLSGKKPRKLIQKYDASHTLGQLSKIRERKRLADLQKIAKDLNTTISIIDKVGFVLDITSQFAKGYHNFQNQEHGDGIFPEVTAEILSRCSELFVTKALMLY